MTQARNNARQDIGHHRFQCILAFRMLVHLSEPKLLSKGYFFPILECNEYVKY
jgi:hypothetical protein